MALEAKKFEQRLRSDTRILKSLREVSPTGMDPEYADWAHSIMLDHGIPTRRDPDHLAETIARPERKYKTLEQFVNAHNVPIDPANPAAVGLPIGHQDYLTIYNPRLPIWDRLLDPKFKDSIDTMSVRQYKAVTNSLRALKKIGQDKGENTINIEGKDYKRSELKQQLIAALDTFSEAKSPVREGNMKIRMWARRMETGLKTMETWVNRLDRFDESGVWTNRVFNPGVNAEHLWGQLNSELVPLLREALKTKGGPRWMQKQIDSGPLYHPAHIFKDADGNPIMAVPKKNKSNKQPKKKVAYKITTSGGKTVLTVDGRQVDITDELRQLADKVRGKKTVNGNVKGIVGQGNVDDDGKGGSNTTTNPVMSRCPYPDGRRSNPTSEAPGTTIRPLPALNAEAD